MLKGSNFDFPARLAVPLAMRSNLVMMRSGKASSHISIYETNYHVKHYYYQVLEFRKKVQVPRCTPELDGIEGGSNGRDWWNIST